MWLVWCKAQPTWLQRQRGGAPTHVAGCEMALHCLARKGGPWFRPRRHTRAMRPGRACGNGALPSDIRYRPDVPLYGPPAARVACIRPAASAQVVPFPGAEQAVQASGGVACVLAGARLDLSAALTKGQVLQALRASGNNAAADGGGLPACTATEALASEVPAGGSGADGAGGGAEGTGGQPAAAGSAAGLDVTGVDEEALYFPLAAYERLMARVPANSGLFNAGSRIPQAVLRSYR